MNYILDREIFCLWVTNLSLESISVSQYFYRSFVETIFDRGSILWIISQTHRSMFNLHHTFLYREIFCSLINSIALQRLKPITRIVARIRMPFNFYWSKHSSTSKLLPLQRLKPITQINARITMRSIDRNIILLPNYFYCNVLNPSLESTSNSYVFNCIAKYFVHETIDHFHCFATS